MANPFANVVLTERLDEHCAVTAWRRLRGRSAVPDSIQILKYKRKSAVYRLNGAGPGGAPIIAKRCDQTTGLVEQMVYDELLPHVSARSLRCYGLCPEPVGDRCWLFLEDAVGDLYSPQNPDHRALAARWLSRLHLAALPDRLKARLPNRGLTHYLQLLQKSRFILQDNLCRNSELLPEDAAVLTKILAYCDLLHGHWGTIEAIQEALPHAAVHGDFVIKNVRIQEGASEPALLVFDWELSGWGVPGTDLAQFIGRVASPDLEVYCEGLRRQKIELGMHAIERAAACGNLLRLVNNVNWATMLLEFVSHDFLIKPIATLQVDEPKLARALGAFGWANA
jgi:hypothetical protein